MLALAQPDKRCGLCAQPSEIRWASRWDTYLMMMDDQQIHWFSIINSLMIVLFLSGMVAMIMMRTLHRDISKYNQLETAEEAQEETGWKLVRRPCLHVLYAHALPKRTLHVKRTHQLPYV